MASAISAITGSTTTGTTSTRRLSVTSSSGGQ